MSGIYVDHAATTPVHPQVVQAMTPYMTELFGNPSSIHSFGQKARGALDQARRTIASLMNIQNGHLVFTSGGTESDNLAIIGTALANQAKGKHIITTQTEHHAVLHTCANLEELGFEITYLPVDEEGKVKIQDLVAALREETILVTLMYGNNETGTLQPITEIGQVLRDKGVTFHTDAVQALGVEQLDIHELPVDLLSLSAHKINGPKGVGLLYIRPDILIKPQLFGGSQERNRRAGTENLAGIIGFAEAIKLAYNEIAEKKELYQKYKDTMLRIFREANVRFTINGQVENGMPHILNVSFLGVKADAMLMNLDLEGVAASSGSACSAGSLQPSHVISAMTTDQARIESAIRFSFGLGNTLEQIERTAETSVKIVQRLVKL
ncbi:cysteine desulfurase family protein [Bacillus horti]|uniref:cysteine desulfurase n=1 Tax=Caldalkalibacillus horti TaxID=77523 RepID=A0ABT9VTA7_9BACI|nr:cysteine desulfurase family protein [Bacillus horti]MDQ0164226.1 cysteine desulfurase [Bacillus horti]